LLTVLPKVTVGEAEPERQRGDEEPEPLLGSKLLLLKALISLLPGTSLDRRLYLYRFF